jgi:ELWxxDGT repeat protein
MGTLVVAGTSSLTYLTAVGDYNGLLLLGATDTTTGAGLYVVLDDGSAVRLTAQNNTTVYAIGAVPGTAFATTSAGMYRTNGTLLGTVLASTTHFPYAWISIGDKRGFIEHGTYYATVDGSDATTTFLGRLVGDYIPPTPPTELGGALYFLGGNGIDGRGLWRTDLTPEGTQLVREVPFTTYAGERTVASGELLVFVGGDPEHGYELWASDGTAAGTRNAADVAPGPASSSMVALFPVGSSEVYFGANDGAHGLEPWRFSH